MGDGYDRFDNEGSGGGSFVIGLLTGTVLGAGLGMLFAPKAGSELRGQLSEQAGKVANQASEQYRRASETASDLADRGREMYDKARDAMSRGADEAQRYVRDATSSTPGRRQPRPDSGRAAIAIPRTASAGLPTGAKGRDEHHCAQHRQRGARLGRRGRCLRRALQPERTPHRWAVASHLAGRQRADVPAGGGGSRLGGEWAARLR
jgi:gas vesicle protein